MFLFSCFILSDPVSLTTAKHDLDIDTIDGIKTSRGVKSSYIPSAKRIVSSDFATISDGIYRNGSTSVSETTHQRNLLEVVVSIG
jgi:hypothetical protein